MKTEDLKGLYIAHRGIQNPNAIENTMSAFSLAIMSKIPIEFDIHILKDGQIVVFHDDNLKRLMGIDKNIESYTYDELKKLFFINSDAHIPLFLDVLKLVNGKVPIIIEVKRSKNMNYIKYCEKILTILKDYHYDFAIKSFDFRVVYWFLHHTNYLTGLLIADRKGSLYDKLMRNSFFLKWLRPKFLSVDYHLLNCLSIEKYRLHNPVLTWTIDNYDTLNQVIDKADGYLIEKFRKFLD